MQVSHTEPAESHEIKVSEWEPPAGPIALLSELDCACRAASNSPEVAVILLEARLPGASVCKSGPTAAESLRRQLLSFRAAEAANRAAGQALQAYYVLAESLRQRDLTQQALERIDAALADLETAREQGLGLGDGEQELHIRRGEVVAQLAEAEAAVVVSNSSLKLLLGEPATSEVLYVPQVDELTAPSFVQSQAISTAISQRAELNAVRLLLYQLSTDTETLAVGVLQQAYPGSSVPLPAGAIAWLGALCPNKESPTLPMRRRQLQYALTGMERTATDEVIRAGSDVVKHRGLQDFAVADAARLTQNREDARDEQKAGRGSYVDVVEAELREIKGRSEVVRQQFAGEIAFAKLRQAEGSLAAVCGWINVTSAASRREPLDALPPATLIPPAEYLIPIGFEDRPRELSPLKQGAANCFIK